MEHILIERTKWKSKYEQMKVVIDEAKENLKREQYAHLIAIFEVGKLEESLKKALGVQKQCVMVVGILFTCLLWLCIEPQFGSIITHTPNLPMH